MEIEYVTHSLDAALTMIEHHVMALGFFDGVHLGHQSLLQQAKAIAKKEGVKFTVMTFDPHPNEIIKRETDRRYITPLDSKLERISTIGADKIFVVKFNFPFASLPADDFIQKYIVGLNAKHVVVGFDFTFGHKAQGTVDYLRKASKNNPFDVTVISKKTHNHEKISSTLIRQLIKDGDVDLVPYYLGHHFEIKGFVPQLNRARQEYLTGMEIVVNNKCVLPAAGVYRVEIKNGTKTGQGLFRRSTSKHDHHEICCFQDMGWVKQGDLEEVTVTFLNQVPFTKKSNYEDNLKEVLN